MATKSFKEFLAEDKGIDYNTYCWLMDSVANNTLEEDLGAATFYLSAEISRLFNKAERDIKRIAREFGLSWKAVVRALKSPSIYTIMRAFRFSFHALYEAVSEASELLRNGLVDVIRDFEQTGVYHAIQKGAIEYNELVMKYPIIKKFTGPVLAGLMVYMWINMTFIGNFKFDMNLSDAVKAARGQYGFADFIRSDNGKAMLILFGTGSIASFPWLGTTMLNLGAALVYTGYVMLGDTKLAKEVKKKIHVRTRG